MSFNPVGWFEIYVDDMERASKFYLEVFQKGEFVDLSMGGELIFGFPFVENGTNASGALVKSPDRSPGVGGVMIYFTCEDCGVEADRIEPAGGRLIQPKSKLDDNHGFIALVQDTEGNLIGLHSNR